VDSAQDAMAPVRRDEGGATAGIGRTLAQRALTAAWGVPLVVVAGREYVKPVPYRTSR